MRHYEATIVIDPSIGEEGIKKQLDRTRSLIQGNRGTILTDDEWGIRSLAYRIAKQDQGFYAIMEFEAPGESIQELNTVMRLDEHVLRHLVIHMDAKALAAREEQKERLALRRAEAAGATRSEDDDDESADEEEENDA